MKKASTLSFVDFFAGIGGFRIGLEKLGWECKYTCEVDKKCTETYNLNFNDQIKAIGIEDVDIEGMPDFDVFCGGFPCQPFSIAGKRKGLDDDRGKVIHSILKICKEKVPKIVFLENVSNIVRLEKGTILKWIIKQFEDLGYNVFYSILNSKNFAVPQARPRFFLVAFRKDLGIVDFDFPEGSENFVPVSTIIEKGDNTIPISDRWEQYIDLYGGKIKACDLSFKLPKTRVSIERADENVDFDDCIYQMRSSGIRALSMEKPFPTFAVSISGGGAMIPVFSKERRHMSLIEIKRLMGFPDDFRFPVARTFAIKQLANAVCPPVIEAIGKQVIDHLSGDSQCLFNLSDISS